jgi:hypothetical protein
MSLAVAQIGIELARAYTVRASAHCAGRRFALANEEIVYAEREYQAAKAALTGPELGAFRDELAELRARIDQADSEIRRRAFPATSSPPESAFRPRPAPIRASSASRP